MMSAFIETPDMDALWTAIERYFSAEKAVNSTEGAIEGTPEELEFHAAIADIMTGALRASTFGGAMAALRFARKEAVDFDGGSMVGALLNGGLAYFDALESRHGTALSSAVTMVEQLDLAGVEDAMWIAINDGLSVAEHGLEGIMQRPQCEAKNSPNAAGRYLEAICDFVTDERRRAMEVLALRPLDMNRHLECLVKLQWAAEESNGEELDDLIHLAGRVQSLREKHFADRQIGKAVRA